MMVSQPHAGKRAWQPATLTKCLALHSPIDVGLKRRRNGQPKRRFRGCHCPLGANNCITARRTLGTEAQTKWTSSTTLPWLPLSSARSQLHHCLVHTWDCRDDEMHLNNTSAAAIALWVQTPGSLPGAHRYLGLKRRRSGRAQQRFRGWHCLLGADNCITARCTRGTEA